MGPSRFDQKSGRRILLLAAAVILVLILLYAKGKRSDSGRSGPDALAEDKAESSTDGTRDGIAVQEISLEETESAETLEKGDEDADSESFEETDSAGRQILPSQKLEPTGRIPSSNHDPASEGNAGESGGPDPGSGPDTEMDDTEEKEEDGVALPVILFD